MRPITNLHNTGLRGMCSRRTDRGGTMAPRHSCRDSCALENPHHWRATPPSCRKPALQEPPAESQPRIGCRSGQPDERACRLLRDMSSFAPSYWERRLPKAHTWLSAPLYGTPRLVRCWPGSVGSGAAGEDWGGWGRPFKSGTLLTASPGRQRPDTLAPATSGRRLHLPRFAALRQTPDSCRVVSRAGGA